MPVENNKKSKEISMDIGREKWAIQFGHVSMGGTAKQFEISCGGSGLSAVWSAESTPSWIIALDGKRVCSMDGLPPPLDGHGFVMAENRNGKYPGRETARSMSGLMAADRFDSVKKRKLLSLAVESGDPYTAICALSEGLDLSIRADWRSGTHPVSAALDKKANEKGELRLKRSVEETRAWLDLLEVFKGTCNYRGITSEGEPNNYTEGEFAAWGGGEARLAALERGADFSRVLEDLGKRSGYDENSAASAMSLLRTLADANDEKTFEMIRKGFKSVLDERDKSRANGNHRICALDRLCERMLAKGHDKTFALVLKAEPRVDLDFAFSSGLGSWVLARKHLPCQGEKNSEKFSKELKKFRAACGEWLGQERFDEMLGKALASRTLTSNEKAWSDYAKTGGKNKLDLSFLGSKSIERGVGSVEHSELEAFDVELLIKAGAPLDLLLEKASTWGESGRLHLAQTISDSIGKEVSTAKTKVKKRVL